MELGHGSTVVDTQLYKYKYEGSQSIITHIQSKKIENFKAVLQHD